jgi:hypothetical protein
LLMRALPKDPGLVGVEPIYPDAYLPMHRRRAYTERRCPTALPRNHVPLSVQTIPATGACGTAGTSTRIRSPLWSSIWILVAPRGRLRGRAAWTVVNGTLELTHLDRVGNLELPRPSGGWTGQAVRREDRRRREVVHGHLEADDTGWSQNLPAAPGGVCCIGCIGAIDRPPHVPHFCAGKASALLRPTPTQSSRLSIEGEEW